MRLWFYENFYITGSLSLVKDSYISSLDTKLSCDFSMPNVVIILYSKVNSFILTSSSKNCNLISFVLLLSLNLLT